MVTGYRNDTISIGDYLYEYKQRLDWLKAEWVQRIYNHVRDDWQGELTFLCFCRDISFCHTYYAINYLVEHPRWSKGFIAHPDLAEFVEGLDWDGQVWRRLPKVEVPLGERTQKWLASLPPAGLPPKELDQGVLF
jgi:hypothetical protein